MQTDFKLDSVHGMLYTGGNVAFSPVGNSLLTPVHNHVTTLDLQQGHTHTHSVCNSTLQAFDVAPDGDLVICIGNRGLGVFYSFASRVALDTISFPPQCSIPCVKFSPCGKYIAVALETTLQVYTAPARRTVTYHGCHRIENVHNATTLPIQHLEWTDDSEHIMISGGDAKISILPRDVRNRKGLAAARNHLIGHRAAVIASYFTNDDATAAVSVSTDNVVVVWKRTETTRKEMMALIMQMKRGVKRGDRDEEMDGASDDEDAVPDSFLEKQKKSAMKDESLKQFLSRGDDGHLSPVLRYAFEIGKKHMLQHKGTVSTAAFHRARALLALGYSNGLFAVHSVNETEVPMLHVLSISSQSLTACSISPSGDHVAFGSEHLKQLVVWDWKGESFLLKEQSHYYDINCTALTPTGATIVSGGDDGKVKVWKRSSGQCFANFTDHTAGVTGLVCSPATNAIFTCSKDGTCRGFDLARYRNFRIFNPDAPTQFSCVAIDPSGELLAAGSARSNVVTLWSVRTGKIVDEFTGHEGNITTLQFHPSGTALVTGSTDKSLMIWNVFTTGNDGERLRHDAETVQITSEPLAMSYSLNGRRLAVLLFNGDVVLYDALVPAELTFIRSWQTKVDATGGWSEGKTGPKSANAHCHFTTLALSPDGETVLCGGESKWICLYHAGQGYLVQKWPVTNNLDFDGAEEQFDYRGLTEAGVMVSDINIALDDQHLQRRKVLELPGSRHRHHATGKRKTALAARSFHVTFASHGRDFTVATTAGLLIFSVDVGRTKFTPLQLTQDVTTKTVEDALAHGRWSVALTGALMLQDEELGLKVLKATPFTAMSVSVSAVPSMAFPTLVVWVGKALQTTPAFELFVRWAKAVLTFSDEPLFGHSRSAATASALRALHKAVAQTKEIQAAVEGNHHTLQYLLQVSKMPPPPEKVKPKRERDVTKALPAVGAESAFA